jgi:hypothetical protein
MTASAKRVSGGCESGQFGAADGLRERAVAVVDLQLPSARNLRSPVGHSVSRILEGDVHNRDPIPHLRPTVEWHREDRGSARKSTGLLNE